MARQVVVYFKGDERDLVRSSQRGGAALSGFSKGAIRAGAALVTGFAARKVVSEINKTVTAASDQREQISQSEQVFRKNSQAINRWSKTASLNFGLTRTQALTNANAFGDMFQQLHIGEGQATRMSTGMVRLAADLASFKNADISQVLEAQQSAFRGEYDALQRFIPGINAARVQQVALNMTHKQSAKDLTDADKALAVHAIMMKDSARAQGDFARTAEGLANARRTVKAVFGDISATVGGVFEPAVRRGTFWVATQLGPALLKVANREAPALGRSVDRMSASFVAGLPKGKQLEGMLTNLAGKLPKIERTFRTASLGVQAFFAAGFGGEGVTTEAGTFVGTMERMGVAAAQIGPKLRQAWAAFREGKGSGDQLVPTLRLSGAALGFVADHADTVAKHLPLLVAGIGAYKGAQALANLASAAQVALMPAQIAATFALARANKSLARSSTEVVVGQGAQRGATTISTVATNLSAGAMLRQRAAALAMAAGSKVAAAGAVLWRGAQMALNFALSANPIGLVILAVAALAAGLVFAYKRSATFRAIVQGAWRGIQGAASGAWSVVRKILANLATGFLNVAGSILHSAARAFGWVPGVGPKLRSAAAKFDEFRGRAQRAIDRLHGKTVDVKARTAVEIGKSVKLYLSSTPNRRAFLGGAKGMLVKEGTTSTADDVLIRVSKNEAVVPAHAAREPGFRSWAASKGIPGFRNGGLVGDAGDVPSNRVTVNAHGSVGPFEQNLPVVQRAFNNAGTALGLGLRASLAAAFKKLAAGGASAIVRYALGFLGVPYVWGGTTPRGWDCSGFMQYVHRHFGISIPRVSRAQAQGGRPAYGGMMPGDLVFYGSPRIHHVGMYIGGGRKVHAPHTGTVTQIGGVGSPVAVRRYWRAAQGAFGYTSGPTLILAGEAGREHVNIQPAPSRARVPLDAMYGQPIVLDVTLTIDGQVLERRLERVRGRDSRRDVPGRGGR